MPEPERRKLTRLDQIKKNRSLSMLVTINQYHGESHAFISRNWIITFNPKKNSYQEHKGKKAFDLLFPGLNKGDWKLWQIPTSEQALQGFGICDPLIDEIPKNNCFCLNCGKPLGEVDPRRKYCPGGKCKIEAFNKERRDLIWLHECPSCHKTFKARDGAVYCSHRCRMRYKRKK